MKWQAWPCRNTIYLPLKSCSWKNWNFMRCLMTQRLYDSSPPPHNLTSALTAKLRNVELSWLGHRLWWYGYFCLYGLNTKCEPCVGNSTQIYAHWHLYIYMYTIESWKLYIRRVKRRLTCSINGHDMVKLLPLDAIWYSYPNDEFLLYICVYCMDNSSVNIIKYFVLIHTLHL